MQRAKRFAVAGHSAGHCAKHGFTLAEAMIATVFLAVSVVGVAGTLSAASESGAWVNQSANCQTLVRRTDRRNLQQVVHQQPNPGHIAGVNVRSSYDDAADYDGYTDSTTTGMTTLQGTAIDFGDGETYTRTAAFEYRATPGGSKVSSGDFGMATVTVTSSAGASVQLQRMISISVLKR